MRIWFTSGKTESLGLLAFKKNFDPYGIEGFRHMKKKLRRLAYSFFPFGSFKKAVLLQRPTLTGAKTELLVPQRQAHIYFAEDLIDYNLLEELANSHVDLLVYRKKAEWGRFPDSAWRPRERVSLMVESTDCGGQR
jgi:hypothetical protein